MEHMYMMRCVVCFSATVVRETEEVWLNVMSDVIYYQTDCSVTGTLAAEVIVLTRRHIVQFEHNYYLNFSFQLPNSLADHMSTTI